MPSGPPAEPPEELAAPFAYEGVWRFTAPALQSSVPQARHAVRDLLAGQRVPAAGEIVDALLLIVSELVTNAVQHAALLSPEITVEVTVGANWVRVAVEDDHPYRPKAVEADEGDVGGRGLWLVKMLTVEAGGKCDVQHTASGGKAVWAELPLAPVGGTTSPPRVR
ncbi:ATP-binding protein [Streptomyces sp. NPDC017529]|uniref:ATP-binding protein n=1 Tax=Streptomyces sp. NPDC017529 TaxID=3365000 RepID=UPI0037938EAF